MQNDEMNAIVATEVSDLLILVIEFDTVLKLSYLMKLPHELV